MSTGSHRLDGSGAESYRLSIHPAFSDKPGKGEHGWLETSAPWTPVTWTLQQLLDHVSAGKAWISGVSIDGRRAGDSIEGAQLIVLDIDGDLPLEMFWHNSYAKRHCLATYTSVSHCTGKRLAEGRPCDDSYRAIFDLGIFVTDRTIYRYAHAELCDRIGFEISDRAGQDPERLWYGSTSAQIHINPNADELPWDLLENAKLESQTQRDAVEQAATRAANVTPGDEAYDIARLRWVIPRLAPSQHGGGSYGYAEYWFQLLAACANHWDQLADVFMQWHDLGEHSTGSDRQHINSKRISRVRGKSPARIFEFAKEQIPGYPKCLPEAIKALNPHRQQRSGAIASSFSREEAEFNVNGPPKGPGTSEVPSTPRLSASASTPPPGTPTPPADPTAAPAGFDEALAALYLLRTTGQVQEPSGLRTLKPSAAKRAEKLMISQIMATMQVYAREPSSIDELLLTMLRQQLNLDPDLPRTPQISKVQAHEHVDGLQFLIQDWLLSGCDHLLYGPAGGGKTQLALHMARAITGDPRESRFLDSGPLQLHRNWQKSRILFVETDMGDTSRANIITMMHKFGWMENQELLDHFDFVYQNTSNNSSPWQMTLAGILRLAEMLKDAAESERPYRLVVIDSLKSVCPDHIRVGQDGFLGYYRTVNELVRSYGISLLWLHHSAPETKRAQGVSAIVEQTNAVIHLSQHPEKKGLSKVEIVKLRGQGKSRTIDIQLMGTTWPVLTNASPDGDDDDDHRNDDSTESILRAVSEHFNAWRREHPDLMGGRVGLYYTGASSNEIQSALKSRGLHLNDRQLRDNLRLLTTTNHLQKRGTTRDTTYLLPSILPTPGPTLDL